VPQINDILEKMTNKRCILNHTANECISVADKKTAIYVTKEMLCGGRWIHEDNIEEIS
jgi:hypothetical protein